MTKDIIQDIETALGRSHISEREYRKWWKFVEVDHESSTYDRDYLKYLRGYVIQPNTMGIYIYEFVDVNGETKTLYVGKSKDIAYRLFNHYKERHDKTGHPTWRTFWQSHPYKMRVYIRSVGHKGDDYLDEASRIIAERYLIAKIKPISEDTFKSVK